ncbi:MAG: cation:proton antiporter [Proteobacteria bacterium]|jgi:CPA2 family monovalent cation:H+ antiporter-2|nr:cation:proton antiporter [Pseudomonadota bacterium]
MNQAFALTPAIILLFIGILAMTLARRIGLSPIVGYLVAGVFIGPHALGLIQESETTHLLAELGVVFLLFDIGLHFTLSSIWDARRDIFGLGPLQIVLCGLAFGGIAIVFGYAPEYAVILGGALALSSTAVVVHTLADRVQQNCPVGLTGTAVLIFQDICAIFLLILAASLDNGDASPAESGLITAVSLAVIKATVAFLAAVLIGRYAIKPLFRLFSQTRNEEVFTAMALLVVLATAAATGHAGLSLTLGAFLGGMIISESPYRHVIQTEAKPFRNLLLGFFFITVGMSLDWRILAGHWAEILVFLVALIAIKALLVAAAARAFGWSTPGSVQLGFLLAQGSEFVFVIIAMPMVREALGESTVGVVITGVAISLACTPTLVALGNSLARIIKQRATASVPTSETTPSATTAPVVVFGMDDVGRTVADALEAHGVPYDAIEGDYDRFLAASADGYPVAFGDPSDVRLMETLAYAEREAIIVSNVRYEVAEALKPVMHDRYPNLTRFIAVDTDDDKVKFEGVGLRPVVNRSFPRGLDLAAAVLHYQGVDETKVQAWMRRQQERGLQTTVGDAAYAADLATR